MMCADCYEREASIKVMGNQPFFAGMPSLMGRGPVIREVCAKCARTYPLNADSCERQRGPTLAGSRRSIARRNNLCRLPRSIDSRDVATGQRIFSKAISQ
jgi:hypothetical protein